MTSSSDRFAEFQKQLSELLTETNSKLDKLISLTISQQLLNECISPEGEVRTAEQCAEIVNESYFAGMCLGEEIKDRTKQFEYQKSEFFLNGALVDPPFGEDPDDSDPNASDFVPRIPSRF
jgi:hypothetical protein